MNPDLNKLCESLPFFLLSSLISMVEWKNYFRFIIKFSTLTSSVRSYHFFHLVLPYTKENLLSCMSFYCYCTAGFCVCIFSIKICWLGTWAASLSRTWRPLFVYFNIIQHTDTPPPAVGTTSPWLKKYIYYNLGLTGGNFVKIRKVSR